MGEDFEWDDDDDGIHSPSIVTPDIIDLKRLAAFSAADEMRYTVTRPFFDGEWFVATDGHRLFATKRPLRANLQAEVYISKEEALQGAVVTYPTPAEMKFPTWRDAVPKSPANAEGRLHVPTWLAGVTVEVPLAFSVLGGVRYGLNEDPNTITINGRLLAPFAGEELSVAFRVGSGSTPEAMVIAKQNAADPYSNDWFALIMPLRRCAVPGIWIPRTVSVPATLPPAGGALDITGTALAGEAFPTGPTGVPVATADLTGCASQPIAVTEINVVPSNR